MDIRCWRQTIRLSLCAIPLGFGVAVHADVETALDTDLDTIEEVVVTAHPLSGEGLAQASIVLSGSQLQRKAAISLGATLALEPGIHNAQFGQAVGRPVIHGLSGPRVRIMEDRIDTLDVSTTSADHAVTVEPFLVDKIEVLKGSSTLLYGSGAIGGVVDVHTGRIPHGLDATVVSGGAEARYDANTRGWNSSFKLDGNDQRRWAWHVDANRKDGDDYKIPGFAETATVRLAEGDSGSTRESERLAGSAFDFDTAAAGLSYITDWGFVGVAVSTMSGRYGLPGAHEEEEEEEALPTAAQDLHDDATAQLDLQQRRWDLEMGVEDPFRGFDSINLRVGVNAYEHSEIEPEGMIATRVDNDAWEARGEGIFSSAHWSGAAGLQINSRQFSALGEEAYTPPVDTLDSGVFLVAERNFDAFELELGARVGQVRHQPQNAGSQRFNTFAASIGVTRSWRTHWRIAALLDVAERAPVAEELFSDGAHLVADAYELGDPGLSPERVTGLSVTVEHARENWNVASTLYHNRFRDFIYQRATGAQREGLRVLQFTQADAHFYGLDLAASVRLAEWQQGEMWLRGQFDFVKARLQQSGDQDLPRMPPTRSGATLDARFANLSFAIEFTHVRAQEAVATYETPTQSYNDLRASLSVDWRWGQADMQVFVQGRNLSDAEQRLHTSAIKDIAPAPGRTLEVGWRVLF